MKKFFHKILIANRGEIAVRIIHTARKLGIATLAVYAEDDRDALHVQLAGEAFFLPGNSLSETYLNQEKLVSLALQSGAEAIHPGYGFLSENAGFARKTEAAGLVFIGATADQISLMGEKTRAVDFAKSLGLPVIPSRHGTVNGMAGGLDLPGFPLLVKASAGGGGKGMQVVEHEADLLKALQRAQRQSLEYFGNDEIFVEKYLPQARHIEVQLVGDGQGNAVHLYERECSIQRRYQKLLEEAPAASVSTEIKQKLYADALRLARAVNYRGAGTVEFLLDGQGNHYFLEMNTRLQVEHPVTEAITGLDLVEWQLAVAAGQGLPLSQSEISQTGHAIEFRICAEDPESGFLPSSGRVNALQLPENCRWDSFLAENTAVSPAYDSLLGKLIVYGATRKAALHQSEQALSSLLVGGLRTNQSFLRKLIQSEAFKKNNIHTGFLEDCLPAFIQQMRDEREMMPVDLLFGVFLLHHFYRPSGKTDPWNQTGYWRLHPVFQLEMNGKIFPVQFMKRKKAYLLSLGSEQHELCDVSYNNNQITLTREGIFHRFYVIDQEQSTEIHGNSYRFALKSLCVQGHFKPEKQTGNSDVVIQSQIRADLHGKVIDVMVSPGERLTKGQNLLVIESMKTEFTVQCPADAVVKTIYVSKGKIVQDKEILVDFES
ncbi:acetyl/propionyl/methylcrotonyl-CoA carboxylase subunit alpha [Gaoshiqia sp. Z1-71]|uniref:acetyl/propionyl/methylcrotonyl-CoA carboxylase subunit alpha n=1 Tax=Gaoshiqia hydrogeniformans TaxID=3290090 RepID=UPI003BF7F33E